MIGLILFLLFVLALAGLVTWALHRDIKRAVERQRQRERDARRRAATVQLHVDISGFVKAMNEAARAMASVSVTPWNRRPCRMCRVLALVGLSHHTRHRGKRRTAW